ncbi:tight junction-associated protein 1 [Bacillus rossius redtenbacheri]|uniref:tight junction-associated protein 1 n=1 Tax=Bacillus rossius redtenbacheri TaxID=93214 RepID=UPI002FDE387B
MAQGSSACKECGWSRQNCCEHSNLHLHVEIENLKQKLLEREHHIVTMETNFLSEADKFPDGEYAALTEELLTWQEKYSRLYESHKRVQKVNQNLEDKLLKIVDKCETEKAALTRDVSNLTQKLVDAEEKVCQLKEENERYRNDVNLAIQLLQCKPANFVSQKYDTLPADLQQKVRLYVSSKRRSSDANGTHKQPELKTIKVPIPTFPPTAMVYSVNKELSEKEEDAEKGGPERRPVDIVSAAIMAKVLEERERERLRTKHCASCTCPRRPGPCKATQTREQPPPVAVATGPRPCSLRLQAGSSNILLDNATSYAPVLYTGRRRDDAGVLVHCPRSRSHSSGSGSDSPAETQI